MTETGTEMDRQVGARIQRARERFGLSQAELSAQIRISEAELQAVELGHQRPNAEVLLDLANSLSVPLSDLLRAPEE
jgi:transcriptional regulator with XRE-family HTH domain